MPYCTSCGSEIPEGQGSSCSMCYGDIGHGSDHYYERWCEEQTRLQEELRIQEEQMDALTQEYLEKARLREEAEITTRDLEELEKIAELKRLEEQRDI